MGARDLPAFAIPFIGRTDELSRIAALLRDPTCRLLTLTGPGGIGKTRLAVEVARLMIDADEVATPGPVSPLTSACTDGCCFVPLQPLTSPDTIVPAIADALHLTFQSMHDPKQQLLGYLRGKDVLPVLDNFEHLAEGANLLPEMLDHAPHLKLLVTSRERLRLREEWLFDVGGLTFPGIGQAAGGEEYSAVQLFLQSARRAGYTPLDADTASIIRICQLSQGIPLAVELAAAWVRIMPCAAIAREVEHSLDILTTTLRNVPDKHRSMRATFERSWELLTGEEQAVFRKLSVFRGGFTREAAERVCGATLSTLVSLVDKSLVQVDGSGRHDLHELLRQYAAGRLLDAGEEDITVQRHGDHFVRLAEGAEAHASGREQIAWFDRLEIELGNLRAAFVWSMETETGLRLAAALGWFFSERSHWSEGLDWLERALTSNPDAPPSLHAQAYNSAAALAGLLGDESGARMLCELALALVRTADDRWNIAWSLSWLGLMALAEHHVAQAAVLLDESLALFRELDDPMGVSHALVRRSWAAGLQDEFLYKYMLVEEAGKLAREAGDRIIACWASYELGRIARRKYLDLEQARIHYESSVSLFREARFANGYMRSLIMLAETEQAMGNWARVQMLLDDVRSSLQEIAPDNAFQSLVLLLLADNALHGGQFERAATLLGAAHSPDLVGGIPPKGAGTADAAGATAVVARAQLGETAFVEAWAAGKGMSLEQTIVYALEEPALPTESADYAETASPASHTLSDTLTARELEIMSLVASGLSNREIAMKLFVTVNTVKWYLKGIFGKLHVTNHAQAVARAQALGLFAQGSSRVDSR